MAEDIVDVAFAEERDIDAAVSAARLAHLEALDVGTRAPSGSTHAIRLGRHGG